MELIQIFTRFDKNNFARTSGQEYHEKDYYDPCLLFQVVLEETYDTFTQLYGGT